MSLRLSILLASCLISLMIAGLLSLQLGEYPVLLAQLLDVAFGNSDRQLHFIIWELRLPRLIVAILAGSALGISGALIQTLTRNPLASPGVMGITSGSALGVVVGIVTFNFSLQGMLLTGMLSGFFCGFILYFLNCHNNLDPLQLTLSGVSISLFCNAAIMVLLVTSSAEANGLYFWLTGSLINRNWLHSQHLLIYIPAAVLLSILLSKPLNLLCLSDEQCLTLGMNLQGWRLLYGSLVVLLVSATVTVTGPVGFIGLVAPHIVRMALGKPFGALDHHLLLPLSALTGASLFCVADVLSIVNQIPVGILVACTGAPIFVYLIHKETRRYVQ